MRLLLLLTLAAAVTADCPRHCECKWRSGKESALCPHAGLTAIPRLPATTQLLDLSENRLSSLRDDIFYSAGLLNLQRLYLISCSIRGIRQHAFRALVNLVELDLSRNRLDAVPSHAFTSTRELRELRLDGNPIARIKDEAFSSLPHLFRLSLKSCKIVEIEPRSFVGLETSLEYFSVDKNRLQVVHAAVLAPLRALKDLELANNPWECTCALRPMRDWMIRRNVPATVVPECALPPRLAGQPWDRLELEDFACSPEVQAAPKHTVGVEGEDVTLVCRVKGVPAPRLRWFRGGRLVANSTNSHYVNSGKSYVVHSVETTSNLTIKSSDMQDAGPYQCSAENRAGKAEITLTLAIQRRPPDKGFGGQALLAGVAVSAVIVLFVCLVAMCAYETRKKRQLDRINEQIVTTNNRAESYEKIEMELSNKNNPSENRRSMVQCEGGRRRGDYRNVPCYDTEDECEGHAARVGRVEPTREPKWRRAEVSPPRAYAWPLRAEPDLHIPRHTYDIRADRTPESVPSSTSIRVIGANMTHISDDNRRNNNPQTRPSTRVRAHDRLDNDLSGSDSEKNYPDLVEMSATSTSYMKNEKMREPYFYTIPRRKDADSRSPLLGSRRNSSGSDSFTSMERKKYETRHKPAGRRSNSFLDLSIGRTRFRRNPSLPSTPTRERPSVLSATPLLDLSGLRNYSQIDQPNEDYDFRASQLEKFLEEYRNLRDQLSKMKETRESLQRNRAAENEELRSIQKGKPSVAVTETSSLAALADAASPLTLGTDQTHEWISTLRYRN